MILSEKLIKRLNDYCNSQGSGGKTKVAEHLGIQLSQLSVMLSAGICPAKYKDSVLSLLRDKPELNSKIIEG